MKMRRTPKKMNLRRETLAHLTPELPSGELAAVAGGYAYTYTCPPTVSFCALSHCVVCSP